MYCSCSNAHLSLRAKPSLCYSRRPGLLDDGRCDEHPLGRVSVNPRFLLYGYYLRQSSLIYWSPLRTFLTGHAGLIYSRLNLRDDDPCFGRVPARRAKCRACCCCCNSERGSRMIRECCRENFCDTEDEIDCYELDHPMWYAKREFETTTNCGHKRRSLSARKDGSSSVCASCGHKTKESQRREISRESSGSPSSKKQYDRKKVNASRREVHDDWKDKNDASHDSSEESDHREREYSRRVSNSKVKSRDSKLIGLSHRERERHFPEEDEDQIRVSRKRSGNHARVSVLDQDLRKEAKDKHSVSSMKQHAELQQRLTEQDNLEFDKRVQKSSSWGVSASRSYADNCTKEKIVEEESKKGSRKLMTELDVHGDDTLVASRSNKYVNDMNIDIAESSSTLKQHHQVDKIVVERADLRTDVSNEYIHNENQFASKNESPKGSQRFFRISEADNAERISSLDSMLDRRKVRDEQFSLSNLKHSTAIEKTVGSYETQEQFENLRRMEEVHSSNIQRASHEERRYSEEVIEKRDDESISVHIARDKIGQVDQQIIDKKEFDERCGNSVSGFHVRENRNASNRHILRQSRLDNQVDYSTSTTNLIHQTGKHQNQPRYHYSQQSGSLRGSGKGSTPKLPREDNEKVSKAQVVINLDIKNEPSDHPYNSRRESIENTKISEYSMIGIQRDSNSQEFSDMQMRKHEETSLLMVEEESKELRNLTGESSHSRSQEVTSTGTLEGGSSSMYTHTQQLDDQTNKNETYPLKGDTLDSAARLESSSTLYVGEFVNKVRQETSSFDVSGTQTEETHTKINQATTSMLQLGRLGTMTKNNEYMHRQEDSRRSSSRSEMKGPSDKIWDVTTPIYQEDKRNDEQGEDVLSARLVDSTTNTPTENAISRRSSKSLWAHIADIIRMGWVHRAESHTSTRKSGKKSSSEGSEAWFSGQDATDDEHDTVGQSTNLKESVPVGGPIQDHGTHSIITQGSLEAPGIVDMQLGSGASTSAGISVGDASIGASLEAPGIVDMQLGSGASTSAGISVGDVSIGASSDSRLEEIELVVNKKRSKDIPSSMTVDQSPPLITDTTSVTIADGPIYTDTVAVPTSDYMKLEEDLRREELSEVRETEGKDGELKRRKFQRKNQLPKETFEDWEEAYRLESEQRRIDEIFMREALVEAQKAADIWEVPVGAVLVYQGKIIARGFNLVEERRDSTAHAEMICIREASNLLRTWRLADTTLYVTLEPCPMCAGAILQARIDTVVWGAPNKLLGADGSWVRLFPGDGGSSSLDASNQIAGPVHPFHPNIKVRRGVLATECSDALQQFFQLRRKKKKKQESPPQSCLPVPNNPIKLFSKMHNMFSIMFCV